MVRRALAALLVGAAATLVVRTLTPPQPPLVSVPVAARDLPAGALPTAADSESLVGRRLAGPLSAGEPVTATRLVAEGLLTGRPATDRVVFVPLSDGHAAAGAEPGRHVDIYQMGRPDLLASDLTVLAVVAPEDPSGGAGAGGPGLLVAAPPGVAGTLAAAQRPDLSAPFLIAVR